jgi:hypothetical protein
MHAQPKPHARRHAYKSHGHIASTRTQHMCYAQRTSACPNAWRASLHAAVLSIQAPARPLLLPVVCHVAAVCWEQMRGDSPAECPALCLAAARCQPAWHHIARRGLGQRIHTAAAGRIEVEMEDTGPRADSQIGACEQGHTWVRRCVRKLMSIARGGWSGSPFVESFVGLKTPAKLRGRERDTALSAYSVPTTRAKEPRQQSADKHATAQTLRLVCPLDPLRYGYPMLICSAGTR